MTPVLVAPPASSPVSLADAKLHCRVDHADEDMLIDALIAAAVGYLDGWRGVLGRAIMPQTWSVSVDCAGRYVLPMPDLTAAEMGGIALAAEATAGGPEIEVDAAGTVLFTCAMPAEQLPAVKVIILLLVGHWYTNREAVSAQMAETPMAVDMLIATLRWRRV